MTESCVGTGLAYWAGASSIHGTRARRLNRGEQVMATVYLSWLKLA